MDLKRIMKEYANLLNDPIETCSARPISDDDPRQWTGAISGPPNTPYADGTFKLSIQFPEGYPLKVPPVMTFTAPIFHPNAFSHGGIRLAELEETGWSPAITVQALLISLQAMLFDPIIQAGCGLNEEAERLYSEDVKMFEESARQATLTHAI